MQGFLENSGLLQQLFAIGYQDVAPHLGVAGGNPREVAKTWPRQRHVVFAVALTGNALHERKSNQVGQMADCRVSRIVSLRRHLCNMTAQCSPDIACLLQLDGQGTLNRRQDDLLAGVEVGISVLDA
ncbi:MAG: hypothetical protein A3E79_00370 [Burkholderiales bacterium RIFCSPHIGHO2_12_FULL_61_11]|nr:MAG: hypothetical protein A3E79_00370 [Burkholderiales bacterium RIFCSPHIGHO2_12_FULL_61_11]